MISRLAATPDGKTLISASYDHTIRYWDMPATLPDGDGNGRAERAHHRRR